MLDGDTNFVIKLKFMKPLILSAKSFRLKKIKCSRIITFWLFDTVFQIQCPIKYQMRIYFATVVLCSRSIGLINFCPPNFVKIDRIKYISIK